MEIVNQLRVGQRLRAIALWLSLLCLLSLVSRPADAEILQAPIGGKAIPLGSARVPCGAPGGGWVYDAKSQALLPPTNSAAVGSAVDLSIAPNAATCATSHATLRLVATGPWPSIDATSIVFAPDQASVEARGRGLTGVSIAWRSSAASGLDTCQNPKLEPGAEHCTWTVGHNMSANPGAGLVWVPPGGRVGPDVVSFGADGRQAAPETFVLSPVRVNLAGLLPPDAAIDLSTGRGEVPLTHAESIVAVDCGEVRCEVARDKLTVRALSSNVNAVEVKFKLLPGVFVARGLGFDAAPVARLAVLHCPMSVTSIPPLRGVENARVVVRIEGRCSNELPGLRFLSGSAALDVISTQSDSTGAEALLRVGSTDAPSLSITAVHKDAPGVAVAVARVDSAPAPPVSETLEIEGYPKLGFIPNNRPAVVHARMLAGHAHLVPLEVPGVYSVKQRGSVFTIIGDPNASGQASLRFGYRDASLAGDFANADLAVLTSPIQRSIHEANITAPFGRSSTGPRPLAEFACGRGLTGSIRVLPGVPAHLPFDLRDSCRVIFHRERLSREFGTQKLTLDVEVVDADGASRGDARISSSIVLRPGPEPLFAWIQGVRRPFDRVIVRLSHAADEAHYVNALEIQTGAPEVKWAAVLGTGHARLYATTAIPTGLYRFGDAHHSGVLTLNFGILSRLTWLDSDGHEGFLGVEGGIMAIGLANETGDTGRPLTQVGAVCGLGISVPIANRAAPTQASINLHGWFEERISSSGPDTGRRAAFIFGPSISIGNVGTNL
jgi:hypothetical protein